MKCLGNPHLSKRVHRYREVNMREPASMPRCGVHEWARLIVIASRIQNYRKTRPFSGGHVDNSAPLKPAQGLRHLGTRTGLAPLGPLGFRRGDIATQLRVLHEVTEVTLEGVPVTLQCFVGLADLPSQPDHGTLGLE